MGDSEGGRLSKNGLVVLRQALGQAPRTEPSHGDYLQRMVQRGDPMMDPFAESGVGVARSIQCRQFGRVIAPTDRPAPLGRSGRHPRWHCATDVFAPRLKDFGAALQQVGSLIRLNNPASRDVGEAGFRDLRRDARFGHPRPRARPEPVQRRVHPGTPKHAPRRVHGQRPALESGGRADAVRDLAIQHGLDPKQRIGSGRLQRAQLAHDTTDGPPMPNGIAQPGCRTCRLTHRAPCSSPTRRSSTSTPTRRPAASISRSLGATFASKK